VREVDEDSLLVVTGLGMMDGVAKPSLGVFAVADGMGGHASGQLASRRVIQVLAEWLVSRLLAPALGGETILPETFEEQAREAVKEANRRLTSEARAAESDMGSTLTLAFVRDGAAIIANVGDSRAYLWRNGILEQVTQDHSMVARLIAEGMLDKDEIYTHPRRSEIYRAIGDQPEIEVDIFLRELQPGDRLVLCCDGVWEMIRDEGITDVLLAFDDPQAACEEMVRQANAAGGEDNISVIVVNVVDFGSFQNF
jgi:protein phosphatase